MTESTAATVDPIALREVTDSGKNVRIVDVRTIVARRTEPTDNPDGHRS